MRLRKTYGRSETTTVEAAQAEKYVSDGLSTVWESKFHQVHSKSLKCLIFLSFQKACTSGIDQSDQRRRCMAKGHIAKECSRDRKCLSCEGKEGRDNRLITRNGKCPKLRKATKKVKFP